MGTDIAIDKLNEVVETINDMVKSWKSNSRLQGDKIAAEARVLLNLVKLCEPMLHYMGNPVNWDLAEQAGVSGRCILLNRFLISKDGKVYWLGCDGNKRERELVLIDSPEAATGFCNIKPYMAAQEFAEKVKKAIHGKHKFAVKAKDRIERMKAISTIIAAMN